MGQQPLNAPVEATGTSPSTSKSQQNSTTLPPVSQNLRPMDRIVNPNAQSSVTSRIVSGSALLQNSQAPAPVTYAPAAAPQGGALEASEAAAAAARGPETQKPVEKQSALLRFLNGATTEIRSSINEHSMKVGVGVGGVGLLLAGVGFSPLVVTTLVAAGGLYAAKGAWDFIRADKAEDYGKAVVEVMVGGTPLVALGSRTFAGARVVESVFSPKNALETRSALHATKVEAAAKQLTTSRSLFDSISQEATAAAQAAIGTPLNSSARSASQALNLARDASEAAVTSHATQLSAVTTEANRRLGRFQLAAQSYRDYLEMDKVKAAAANSSVGGRLVSAGKKVVSLAVVTGSVLIGWELLNRDTTTTKGIIGTITGWFGGAIDYFSGNPKPEAVNTPTQPSIDMTSQPLAALTNPNNQPVARPGSASTISGSSAMLAPQSQVSDVSNAISRDADPVMRNLLYAVRETMKEENQRLNGGSSTNSYFHPLSLSLMHTGQRQWSTVTEYSAMKDVDVARAILSDLRRDPTNGGYADVIFTKYFSGDKRLGLAATQRFDAFQGGR